MQYIARKYKGLSYNTYTYNDEWTKEFYAEIMRKDKKLKYQIFTEENNNLTLIEESFKQNNTIFHYINNLRRPLRVHGLCYRNKCNFELV